MAQNKSILILGTRGIPAAHGGFETFAEQLSQFLVEHGWHVGVYCQHEVDVVSKRLSTDCWHGVERIHVEVTGRGPLASLDFDWRCIRDAATRDSLCLVLGYNSALFLPYLVAKGRKVLTNMDGLEWRRTKWSLPVRGWFWLNEWIAAWSSHHLIADHPAIADHLATRRSRDATVMIPYGGDPVLSASTAPLDRYGLKPDNYLVSIARIEPENHILQMVKAFSQRRRGAKLMVLGKIDPAIKYHRALLEAASDEVQFPGGIYDADTVRALRFHARAYLHGHSVGGTNPSLVEALWAGNAVVAHDNEFNRWTAGERQFYFTDIASCDAMIETVLHNHLAVGAARAAARARAVEQFGWRGVLDAYERLLVTASREDSRAPQFRPARIASR